MLTEPSGNSEPSPYAAPCRQTEASPATAAKPRALFVIRRSFIEVLLMRIFGFIRPTMCRNSPKLTHLVAQESQFCSELALQSRKTRFVAKNPGCGGACDFLGPLGCVGCKDCATRQADFGTHEIAHTRCWVMVLLRNTSMKPRKDNADRIRPFLDSIERSIEAARRKRTQVDDSDPQTSGRTGGSGRRLARPLQPSPDPLRPTEN